ncbi:hypothetical protein M9435_006336 [Picochlorum sp. BPE23]|nr:hypothetical protein M9435_006336 [Picochlorum sp. BPE23]
MKCCSACGSNVNSSPIVCDGCGCLYFCSKSHQQRYIDQGGHSREDCIRLREFRSSALEDGFYTSLAPLFSWCVTDNLYSSPCDMLEKIGVHRKDPFRMECSCGVGNASAFCVSGPLVQGWFGRHVSERRKHVDVTTDSIRPQLDAWWGTEGSSCVLDGSPVEVYDSIVDWQSYLEYKRRRTRTAEQEKLMVLMDIPLTIFWAIKRFLRNNNSSARTHVIQLVLAGCEKELDQWPLLLELFNLLPGYSFDITMAGPELPSWMDQKCINITSSTTSKELKITCRSTTVSIQLMAESHIVCALNAGIGAYPSWMDTVCHIKSLMATRHSPSMFFFTDYVQESIEVARKNLYMLFGKTCIPEYDGKLPFLGMGDIAMACGGHPQKTKECSEFLYTHVKATAVLMNPFRKPANVTMPSHGMPYASNGFGCSLEIRV